MGVIVISLWSTSMGIKVTICISICILAIISVVAKISTYIPIHGIEPYII